MPDIAGNIQPWQGYSGPMQMAGQKTCAGRCLWVSTSSVFDMAQGMLR